MSHISRTMRFAWNVIWSFIVGLSLGAGVAMVWSDATQVTGPSSRVAQPVVYHGMLEPLGRADLPFADLVGQPADRLLATIDGLPAADALTAVQRAGLTVLMTTRGVEPVIRNNIANRLTGMAQPDPGLWRMFLGMYRDPSEDEVWRDYSIQFLALSLPAADDRAAALSALCQIAEQDRGTIGTTALLHIVRLANNGTVPRPATLAALAEARIRDPLAPDPSRHVALALIGQEGWRECLPLVRTVLEEGPGVDATRGALYTLGVMGDPADAALISGFASSTHPAIAKAAAVAAGRLAERTPAQGAQP
jgi:hypothetical protein